MNCGTNHWDICAFHSVGVPCGRCVYLAKKKESSVFRLKHHFIVVSRLICNHGLTQKKGKVNGFFLLRFKWLMTILIKYLKITVVRYCLGRKFSLSESITNDFILLHHGRYYLLRPRVFFHQNFESTYKQYSTNEFQKKLSSISLSLKQQDHKNIDGSGLD